MTPLSRHLIIVGLCLAATIAAKLYVDKVLLGEDSPQAPARAAAQSSEGTTVALP